MAKLSCGIGVSRRESVMFSSSRDSLPEIMPSGKDMLTNGVRLVTTIVRVMLAEAYASFLATIRTV
ncbi:hypothetical protein EU519_00330 [Candidatus Thorarchaeota archaeon]|nr:MAG: hypothetical protein EU519_00330 [Candidatus Thorarchaeota archaeon]